MLNAQQIPPPPFRMATAVMDSIVILDDDDEEEAASSSTSCSKPMTCQSTTTLKKQQPQPTHITQSPFATAKKDAHVLQAENEKLFAEFVEHCSKHSQDHPEVMTYLQSRYSKAQPTFLSSVEFRNTLGRCLTRAQANTGKTFVYINELCTVLKQHTVRKRSSIQSIPPKGITEDKSNGNDLKEEEQDKKEEEQQEAAESQKTKRASRRQIAYLENLLRVYNEEIKRLQERELSVEELEKEDSSYIQEHKLKRKMMKIYEKLCELKGCNTLTGRVIEQKITYTGTRYPEINKKIERYINSQEVLHNPPDYSDILKVVQRANNRYNLMFSRKQITQIAQEAFRETGNKLQERRHLDMVYNFGSHLTDSYKPTLDPALIDPALHRKLRSNRDMAISSLENVINKFAIKQEDVEVEEMRKKQERDKQKKEELNGQQSDSKEKESEKNKEEQEEEEEQEEDEEEEDNSSDPDIEEEIQASEAQVGADDEEEDIEEEPTNISDNEQQINDNSPASIKSSLQDTEEDQGEGMGDDDQQSPVNSTHEAVSVETTTDGRHAKESPQSPANISQSEAVGLLPIKKKSSNHCSQKSTRNCTETISTNNDSTLMRSANCSPLPPSPMFIDEMGQYKKRKRTSREKQTTVYNGNGTQDSGSDCDIPLDMGVSCSPERLYLTRARSQRTPPPKKNKVNVATQCDPEEVIELSDSD
ncbi:death domain-associated protein 6-like isoform X2 [Myxocyprinus asiaticus]|uniref:death domain-associated protein 6-like isoform X2 n=1 Tax=Myxocyprinus asiaticus TaxID=70543 RepID=UPI0022221359|nr:death domain-associated protein 6-like isoform X2 [Myxocyprinus asiaticus]